MVYYTKFSYLFDGVALLVVGQPCDCYCSSKVIQALYALSTKRGFVFRLFQSLWNSTSACRDVCQISRWYDHYNAQPRYFETSWDLTARHTSAKCIETQSDWKNHWYMTIKKKWQRATAGHVSADVPFNAWTSCQIRKITGAHAPGMPGTFSPPP